MQRTLIWEALRKQIRDCAHKAVIEMTLGASSTVCSPRILATKSSSLINSSMGWQIDKPPAQVILSRDSGQQRPLLSLKLWLLILEALERLLMAYQVQWLLVSLPLSRLLVETLPETPWATPSRQEIKVFCQLKMLQLSSSTSWGRAWIQTAILPRKWPSSFSWTFARRRN